MAHAKGGRFAIFRPPIGVYQFSACYQKLSPGDPAVHLELADGGSYCVRLTASLRSGSPLVPFGITHSVIKQVSCDKASKEAGKYKPLEMKLVDPGATVGLVNSNTFPQFNR